MKPLSPPPYTAGLMDERGERLSTPWTSWLRELFDWVRPMPTTVANLPAATAGTRAFVSDATVTTFASIVAGGGTNPVPVYSDGTNWRIG